MKLNKRFVFLFFLVCYWFLCGGPNFASHPTSLLLYIIGALYFMSIIWNKKVFDLFYGDSYTYGYAGLGVAMAIGYPAILITIFLIRFDSIITNIPSWASYVVIGLLLMGLFIAVSIPIFTSNEVEVLPLKESRRWFDDETTVTRESIDAELD